MYSTQQNIWQHQSSGQSQFCIFNLIELQNLKEYTSGILANGKKILNHYSVLFI